MRARGTGDVDEQVRAREVGEQLRALQRSREQIIEAKEIATALEGELGEAFALAAHAANDPPAREQALGDGEANIGAEVGDDGVSLAHGALASRSGTFR